jgi:iron(III) transport system ATP-binding protein
MSGVKLTGLRQSYTGARGIEHLDITVDEGEFFVLLGPSGCGKTTALRCIAGLEEPDQGVIVIGDKIVAAPQQGVFVPPNKRDLGMVFQSYALWPHLTVERNVAYPLRARRWQADAIESAIQRALALVDLVALKDRYPGELSGGQQQRVALARAIAASPKLILFDEPLSNLDAQLRTRLRQDLHRVHKETRHTAVYVTHDQTEALALADRVAVMRDGRAEQIGKPDDIFLSPATRFVAEFVGYDNLFTGIVEASYADDAQIRVPGQNGTLIARTARRLVPGDRVHLAIRSNRVRLHDAPTSLTGNLVEGRIEDVSYLGDTYQCTLNGARGLPLIAQIPADEWRSTGSGLLGKTIHASLPVAELIALPA